MKAIPGFPSYYIDKSGSVYHNNQKLKATVVKEGYSFVSLYKNDGFRYNDTIKSLPKLIFSILIAIFMCVIYKNIMPQFNGFIGNMLYLGIIGLLTLTVYFLINKDTIIKLLKEKK